MREKEGAALSKEEIAELKFYIPEDMSATIETDGIVKLLLNQFKEANLLEAIDGIQRYRNVVELTVLSEYRQHFLKTPITWCRCSSYLVTENEPIIIINIYAARLTSRWTDLVNKFNEFGKVVIYYDLKENYNGHEVKTGVRSIWLKDIIKRPKELTQGNRKLRVVYDKEIMNKLLNISEITTDKSIEPMDQSNSITRDELEAKFANLLNSSSIDEDKESWDHTSTSITTSDNHGLFGELKGQLETILDTEEPPEPQQEPRKSSTTERIVRNSKQSISIERPQTPPLHQQPRQPRESSASAPWRTETPM